MSCRLPPVSSQNRLNRALAAELRPVSVSVKNRHRVGPSPAATLDQVTNDELVDFARRYTASWCSHDAASVAACFSETGSITVNDGEPAIGRSAIPTLVQGFYDTFPDTVVLMDEARAAGGHGIYLWTFEGTNTGPGGTGQAVRFSGWEKWTFSDDGLIEVSDGRFDTAEYERQLVEGV